MKLGIVKYTRFLRPYGNVCRHLIEKEEEEEFVVTIWKQAAVKTQRSRVCCCCFRARGVSLVR